MKRVVATASVISLLFLMVIGGCSGGGTGGDSTSGTGTTVVSGKVTLSSSILGKPQMLRKLAESGQLRAPVRGAADQPGPVLNADLLKTLNAPLFQAALANAQIDMYDADHPEWLYPVAAGSSDANGEYVLSTMTNASKNEGASYVDGSAIPAGSYTLVAYSGFGLGQKPIVAVQSIVKNFEGEIQNVDFEVLPSDVAPEVIYMFGVKKNRDGTQRWGYNDSGVTATLPSNSAVQVSFSLPMWRDSLAEGITISPAIAGKWSLSADWLTATYYLDPGEQMTPGQVYTITINGEDKDNVPRALNVYGNAPKLSAFGKFTATAADTIGPTVQWNSPTVIEMGGTVDVTQSFRIESNKPLDVNGITLRGVPSIGVKPGVLFLGKGTSGLYVYEFLLGTPLKLGTNYKLTVTGGKDLAGQSINTLTGSLTTNSADDTPGIDPAAAPDIQDLQAQVKSVFGKWVRSANDRNIAQLQSVMSGDFYMEYDVALRGIDQDWDINRDGRLSLGEFSRQLATYTFPQWEYCGSVLSGSISPEPGTYINVVPLTMSADFEFRLTAENAVNLSRCFDAAPRESMYMSLRYVNGGWKIIRGSIGIDTRDKLITKPNLINVKLEQDVYPFYTSGPQDVEIADGGLMSAIPDNINLRGVFSWDSTSGVNTYIVVVTNERDPFNGLAVAFPSTVKSVSTDKDPIADLKGIDIGGKMGFDSVANFQFQEGGKYYWEVIGLGTATATPDPNNPNDPDFVGNKTARDILRDITAVSKVRRFGIAGLFSELTVEVRAGSTGTNAPTTYNPAIFGYDVGSAFQATITVYTPNSDAGMTAVISQSASAYKTYEIPFTNRTATLTIPLYKGVNSFSVRENISGAYGLYKSFWIITQGGKPPIISVWEVTDDLGNTLSAVPDGWSYYKAPGASKINILGSSSDMAVDTVDVIVSNEFGPYTRTTVTTSQVGDNTFDTGTLTPPDIEIYKGNNAIMLYKYLYGGPTVTRYRTRMTVWTDTGSVWVPPILISSITATGNSTITKTADNTTSSDWTADLDALANFTITINGTFKNISNGRYYTSSEGGYDNGNLAVDGGGNWKFNAVLYSGWNNISIYDVNNNGYWMYIYTANGKPVIKPEITKIDGIAYNASTSGGKYADTNCSATIEGTAEAGPMWAYWSGALGNNNYYESQNVVNANGTFKFSVPLVGPGGTNIVDINDYQGRWTSVSITTTGNCAYTPPTFAITSVTTSTNLAIAPSGNDYYAGATATVNVSGTSSRDGAQIRLRVWNCGQEDVFTTNAAANGTWTLSGIKVYGISGGYWNSLNFDFAEQYQYINVYSQNSFSPVIRTQLTSMIGDAGAASFTGGSCGNSNWDAGSSTKITVKGTTSAQNGKMYFRDTLNTYGNVPIVSGVFEIKDVPLFTATDNRIEVYNYNDPAGYTSHYMTIAASNGIPKPRFVQITSPGHGTTGLNGPVLVSGTISDPIGSGFTGSNGQIYAQVYACGTWNYFTNDTWMQQNYGYGTASLGASSFSFTPTFCSGQTSNVYVDVYDYNTGASHYHQVYYNYVTTPAESWSKPGVKTTAPKDGRQRMLDADATRKAISVMPK